MSNPLLRINREQLEKFIGEDAAAIRAFEELFKQADAGSGVVPSTGDFTIEASREQTIAWTIGASDPTATLPLLSAGVAGDIVEIAKIDSGVGFGKVDANGTEEIDGVAVSTALLFSQYNTVRLKHMGTFWRIIELSSNGSNANGEYIRFSNGTQICKVSRATTEAIGTAYGALYRNATAQTWTYPKAFVSNAAVSGLSTESGNASWLVTYAAGLTSINYYHISAVSAGSATWYAMFTAIGRWRT